MERRKVEPGAVFGGWTVIEKDTKRIGYYKCRCLCGIERSVYGPSLQHGRSRSCGHAEYGTNLSEAQYRLARNRKCLYNLAYSKTLEILHNQGNKCAICKRPFKNDKFCVDHDHIINKVRGFLCNGCNTMLGNVGDSPEILEAGARYLRQHSTMDSDSYDI